jgi:hypothetical protein
MRDKTVQYVRDLDKDFIKKLSSPRGTERCLDLFLAQNA